MEWVLYHFVVEGEGRPDAQTVAACEEVVGAGKVEGERLGEMYMPELDVKEVHHAVVSRHFAPAAAVVPG